MKLSELKVNSAAIEQGRWITIPGTGMKFKVRGSGNADWRRMSDKLVAAVPLNKRDDPLEQDKIDATLLVETSLLDWSGVEDDNGELPFSQDTARTLLMDPDYRRLMNVIRVAADNVWKETDEANGEDAKN